MRWIRPHVGTSAWIALIALAIHLIVTFGHVHAGMFFSASIAQITADDGQAGDDGDGDYAPAHNFCDVCASIGLLANSVLPVAQTLAPPPAIVGVGQPDFADAAAPREPRSSFKARAPPSA
jgi:hypothetical protein